MQLKTRHLDDKLYGASWKKHVLGSLSVALSFHFLLWYVVDVKETSCVRGLRAYL